MSLVSYSLSLSGACCHVMTQQEGPQQMQPLDLGLPNLQNCNKYISALYKLPRLLYSTIAAQKAQFFLSFA
jgi:hypothetical protein